MSARSRSEALMPKPAEGEGLLMGVPGRGEALIAKRAARRTAQ
jgi:hypothetical protein